MKNCGGAEGQYPHRNSIVVITDRRPVWHDNREFVPEGFQGPSGMPGIAGDDRTVEGSYNQSTVSLNFVYYQINHYTFDCDWTQQHKIPRHSQAIPSLCSKGSDH